jgi:hypothetical protein
MPTFNLTERDVFRLTAGPEALALRSHERGVQRQDQRKQQIRARKTLALAQGRQNEADHADVAIARANAQEMATVLRLAEASDEYAEVIADVLEKHGISRDAGVLATVIVDDDGLPTSIEVA